MNKDAKIFIAAHTGMVGSSLVHYFKDEGYTNLITPELELTDQSEVDKFFLAESLDYVILAAGKAGGIVANRKYPAEFSYNNLQIQNNVIHFAWKAGVKKLLFLASSCIYPKICPQPMKEDYLLTGSLEPTSEPYAIAKIAGIKMCQSYHRQYHTNFISVVPDNLYGPNDDFDPETSHVLAALLHKFHLAKVEGKSSVTVWGTGKPRRGFLYVDDLADACIFLMNNYHDSEIINVGYGEDLLVKDLVLLIRDVVGVEAEIIFDSSKPDGAPRKLLDASKIRKMGWTPKVSLEEGIRRTYDWYKEQVATKKVTR
ncbi:GDP-L-fucose synthase [subsurface metagenome]